MLELSVLLLRDARDGEPRNESGRVVIVDGASGASVGSVQSAGVRASWLRWLVPSVWDVLETEDLSLVFTLRRSWRFSAEWSVRDAEGRHVGAVIGVPRRFGVWLSDVPRGLVERVSATRIEDGTGRCLAQVRAEMPQAARFVTPTGTELGALAWSAGETRLTFGESAADDPFTRMLLLAAALVAPDMATRPPRR